MREQQKETGSIPLTKPRLWRTPSGSTYSACSMSLKGPFLEGGAWNRGKEQVHVDGVDGAEAGGLLYVKQLHPTTVLCCVTY